MITAKDLLPTIKKLAASYVKEIGSGDSSQNEYLFAYITHALRKLAHVAYLMYESDPVTISSDGYKVFTRGGVNIKNLYSPLRVISPEGREVEKRTSYSDAKGWWRESANTEIHVKGLPPGDYTLHYLAYPTVVSDENSPIEFPDSGTMGLCYYAAALIVESLPSAKDLAIHYYTLSQQHIKIAVQANIDARGQQSGGYVPSLSTIDVAFKG